MKSGIYAYYDNVKEQIVYVGQSTNIPKRHKDHLSPTFYCAQRINKVLQSNPNRYSLIILKKCSPKDLDYWEVTLIALFNPKFNFTHGGHGMRGYKHSNTTKAKLKKAWETRTVTEDHKLNLSKTINRSGFFHVYKEKTPGCKRGFTWRYQYYDDVGKLRRLGSVSLFKLKQKVLDKGLEWKIVNETLAKQTIQNERVGR